MNPRLRSAIQAAKDQNMPNDNIDRAIKKGTGELAGDHFEEIIYEGYGPGGVALLAEAATDNKNRTAADLRSLFSKHQGNLATSGSVLYLFNRKGQILVNAPASEEDRLLETVLEAGVEEMSHDEGQFEILVAPERLYEAAEAVRNAGFEVTGQCLTYLPTNTVPVTDQATAAQILRLYELLEEHDDTQQVYSNFDIPDEYLQNHSN